MLGTRFKTGIVEGNEIYVFEQAGHRQPTTKTIPFPDSLIAFLRMDVDVSEPLFQKAADALDALIQTHNAEYARKVSAVLGVLSKRHIFFEFLRQDWQDRISTAQELDSYTEKLLCPASLRRIPEDMRIIQKQTAHLFACVLDKDGDHEPISAKMTKYCDGDGGLVFQFSPLAMRFEFLGQQGFTNVLYPKSIYELVDYHLRECVKRGIKVRVCKSCGRYFPVRGQGDALYCTITTDQKGLTCKDRRYFYHRSINKEKAGAFQVYRREYKRRHAWIGSGRITQEDFHAWSKAASEKRINCKAGKISIEEFSAWLKES